MGMAGKVGSGCLHMTSPAWWSQGFYFLGSLERVFQKTGSGNDQLFKVLAWK